MADTTCVTHSNLKIVFITLISGHMRHTVG